MITTKYIVRLTATDKDGNKQTYYICKGEHTKYELTYWPSNLVEFDSLEEVQKEVGNNITNPSKETYNVYSDGDVKPPRLIWSGIGICYAKPTGSMTAEIIEVVLSPIQAFTVSWDGKEVTSEEIQVPKQTTR